MKCGASRVVITPRVGVDLAGFAARQGPSVGVHDDLYARALYLAAGDERLLWLHADLIGLSRELTAEVREQLAAEFGLAPRQVLLSATHTHSGPATVFLRWCGDMDGDYMAALPGYLLQAAREAIAEAEDVTLRVGEGRCTLGQDRRPPGPWSHADSALPVVGFQRGDGSYAALLANYAMHNVALSSENRHISADVSGAAARPPGAPPRPPGLPVHAGRLRQHQPARREPLLPSHAAVRRAARQEAVYALQVQAVSSSLPGYRALVALDLPLDVLAPQRWKRNTCAR